MAKTPTKSASKATTKALKDIKKPKTVPKKRSKKRIESYDNCICKVLKQVYPDTGISKKAMCIMNNCITEIFNRVAEYAGELFTINKKPTLQSREIQTAVRLVLSGKLKEHAASEGAKAMTKFTSSSS